jgi:hypothetical protein
MLQDNGMYIAEFILKVIPWYKADIAEKIVSVICHDVEKILFNPFTPGCSVVLYEPPSLSGVEAGGLGQHEVSLQY